jgi:SAM-dependent methyltransferase
MNNKLTVEEVREAAFTVISKLPKYWQDFRRLQVNRVAEEISWIYINGGTVVDLGGSNGFHCSVCSVLGMKSICVDNFKTRGMGTSWDYFYEQDLEAESVSRKFGVEFIHTDLLTWKPPFENSSVDVVMTFDNIEHLHNSPRDTYLNLLPCLKVNGQFLIGGPNAANILKRVRLLFGQNTFAKLEEWYDHPLFVGHVREPVVADYRYIAKDLGLEIERIMGRNWLGYHKYGENTITKIIDVSLRLNPNLCSDIYLLSKKIS